MEEILASIRRIISDDEPGSAQPSPASASQQGDESVEAQEGDADERIISDIARVLSDTTPPVEDEEDILDLTAELGGTEIVEEVLIEEAAAPVEMPPIEMQPDEMQLDEMQPDEMPVENVQPEEASPPPPVAVEAPPPQEETPAPRPPMSASEEAASALERAIAALRAGQVPTSVAEFMPTPEPVLPTEPEPEPEAEAAPEPEAAPVPEPEAETDLESEPPLVVSEFAEVIVEETVTVEALPTESAEEEEGADEPEEGIPWTGSPASLVERERHNAGRNGGEHRASPLDPSNKSLEDSVKDLLRPMLKQWLDENMPRVLTAALKDELGDHNSRRQRD
jgi:uncharacterized protein